MHDLPCSSDGFTHLQYLKHDGQAQLERLELTQQILHLSLLETPFDSLRYCDRSNMAPVVSSLGQIDHILDLIEDHLALVPYLRSSFYSAVGSDRPPFFHRLADLLEHEGEEGDALGDAMDVAFSVGNLRCHSVEDERQAKTGPRDPDD